MGLEIIDIRCGLFSQAWIDLFDMAGRGLVERGACRYSFVVDVFPCDPCGPLQEFSVNDN
jgi:hypothetical protein